MGHAAGAMEYGLHLLESADAPELEEVAIGSTEAIIGTLREFEWGVRGFQDLIWSIFYIIYFVWPDIFQS